MKLKEGLLCFSKNEGISLVALVVTIIILLVLAGVSFYISNNYILNKASNASTETLDASVKEIVQLCIADTKMAYISEKSQVDEKEFYLNYIESYLQNYDSIENLLVDVDDNNTSTISLDYKGNNYNFVVSKDGTVEVNEFVSQNLKVGDYVEYPITYYDVYSNEYYSETNGWRVLDDGKISGTIKIISSGVPAKWFYDVEEYSTPEIAVTDLKQNFCNLDLEDYEFNTIKGEYFFNDNYGENITTLNLSEFNCAYNSLTNTNREENETEKLSKIDGFIYLSEKTSKYWIMSEINNRLYITTNGFMYASSNTRSGIRPVVYLKNNIYGHKENNVWKIKCKGE